MLFNAVTVFRVTFLSPIVRRDGESSEAFCARVRSAIVATLQASAPEETVERALERPPKAERTATAPAAARGRSAAAGGARSGAQSSKRLDRWVQQVREVLPNAPTSLIQAELGEDLEAAVVGCRPCLRFSLLLQILQCHRIIYVFFIRHIFHLELRGENEN